jgi:hypothetical protein
MKLRTIIGLIYYTVFCFNIEAQNKNEPVNNDSSRSEIFAGYGVYTTMDLALNMQYLITLPMAWGADVYEPHYTGAFFCGYQNRVSERVRLSTTYSYEQIRLVGINTPDSKTGNCFSILGGVKLKYNNIMSRVDFYGRLDIGMMMFNAEQVDNIEKNKSTAFAFTFQLSPLCLRIGKQIGGFFEFGFGNLGTFNFGIDYRF